MGIDIERDVLVLMRCIYRANGLDHFGFSTQAYFFDFDNDEDLRNNITIDPSIQAIKEDYNSDQLFRNEGVRLFLSIA